MKRHSMTRRSFLGSLALSAIGPTIIDRVPYYALGESRHLHFVYVDVFASQRLQGNPLAVFTDARGLTDEEMYALARETNLQETAFVLPGDPVADATQGVKVRIFTPEEELPFAGHPTLGTATVLRSLRRSRTGQGDDTAVSTIVLSMKVGKVPVSFHEDQNGTFGEMRQIPPIFGRVHDRNTVAAALGLSVTEFDSDIPIQTISTGLPYVIVPLKRSNTLHALQPGLRMAYEYMKLHEKEANPFYFVTRDTGDPKIGLAARAIYPNGEDPATGSAAGCTSAWMVKYGLAPPDETVVILQGVEIKRPSKLYVRSSRDASGVSNVRVGGYATLAMEGEAFL
jgi:trans-2,3-dihydro-3-hydroxyanthranilate isomerase